MSEEKKVSIIIPLSSGFSHVLFNIASQGYDYIRVTYGGSGDEGAIEEVEAVPQGLVTVKSNEPSLEYPDITKVVDVDDELRRLIEDNVYRHILNTADDWYNNEGGGGTLFISTLDGSYHCYHYTNETVTHETTLTGKFGDNGASPST